MTRLEVNEAYFDWMYELVCSGRYARGNSFMKLISYLHDIQFTYIVPKDSNRAEDGIDLRYRFAYENNMDKNDTMDKLRGPCTVLEMMIALSIRCEDFMDDPSIGNRTAQWFWKMIVSLGLGSMTDRQFDEYYVEDTIEKFLAREYDADGRGGLFTVKNSEYDMRDMEIWDQLCYYLDTMI